MMRLLIAGILILSAALTSGCATMGKMDEVAAWTRDKLADISSELADIKAKQEADIAKLELALGHKLDLNGDGIVSTAEAERAYLELAAGAVVDPGKSEALLDPNMLLAMLMAVLGLGGGAGAMAWKQRGTTKAAKGE